MKKIIAIISFFILACLPVYSYAESAKIIEKKGDVSVKKMLDADWSNAKLNMILGKNDEVKTGANSSCTIAFDREESNILTLKENTLIKIEGVIPGNIFLPEGRVFTLINNISSAKKFEVKTPTAVSGARGTGWMSGFHLNQSEFSCFKNIIYINSLDQLGNVISQQNLESGFRVTVGPEGLFGNTSVLGPDDYEQWNDFFSGAESFGGSDNGPGDSIGDLMGDDPTGADDILDEMKQQHLEDMRQDPEPDNTPEPDNPNTPEER